MLKQKNTVIEAENMQVRGGCTKTVEYGNCSRK